ncbi:unnamed protein product [Camellia sinensis]
MLWLLHNLHIHLILLCCLSSLNFGFSATIQSSNETDRLSLLAIKAKIIDDPLHVLSSWNDSIHFCMWQGIKCEHRGQRVTALDLQSRKLVGSISPHLGNLSFMRELQLQNNSFGNEIPLEIGEVPVDLGFLSKLATVIIHDNNLTGSLSPLANLSSLKALSAAENFFDGSIPDGFGQLKNLQKLAIGINRLSGVIPPSLFNLSSLTMFDVIGNQIQGSLPWVLGITLPNIEFFNICDNQFTGLIPASISNSSKLHYLIMVQNKLIGKVPNLERLRNLEWLSISGNQLGSGEADDLNFISSLINATNLQVLGVNLNNFGGELPGSIGNLSGNLQVLYLDNNKIFGSIPPGIVNLVGLQSLYMQVNQLTGTIPSEIGKLQNLQELNLINNSLSGNIPSSLGNLSLLSELVLGINNFQGNIPQSLGNCNNLQLLFLSQNNLNGTIPKQVWFSSHGSWKFGKSRELDLANNNLSGEIPVFLEGFRLLQDLNLSFNNFEGVVPTQGVFSNTSAISVVGNSKLCGGVAELQLPKCNFKVDKKWRPNTALILALSIPFGLLGLALVGCILYLCCFRKTRKETPLDSSDNSLLKASYQNLVKATDGFSSFNLIGVGSFGSVYKGVLDGRIVAVKVLNLSRRGASKSFISECEALRNIRHRNLVKVLTACSTVDYQGNEFKALVYEFMINGSLEEWLHQNPKKYLSNEELRMLNLLQRLNIIIDVVCALNYLHNQVQTPIVHCDLQPSNVILDKDMIGHVGDFGLAKFLLDYATHDLSTNETSSIGIRGTIGYTAPEMFTGKRPTDEIVLEPFHPFLPVDWRHMRPLPPPEGCLVTSRSQKLSGNISPYIGNLCFLRALHLQNNSFGHVIPPELDRLRRLDILHLHNNSIGGNLSYLQKFVATINNFHGSIPDTFGKLTNLQLEIDLRYNNYGGMRSETIGNPSTNLQNMDLDQNQILGSIPSGIGNLINLERLWLFSSSIYLNISENMLSGEIPGILSSCVMLETLCMEGYLRQGTIPSTLTSLRSVQILDLSHNNLLGRIPEYLEAFKLLQILNLSNNDFEGAVPTKGIFTNASAISVKGNRKLCGVGILEYGATIVAVKVLNLQRHGASKSFVAECKALRNIKHRKLIKVLTACLGVDYQVNREDELDNEPKKLNLHQRLNISIDVACALDYLHHQCPTPIVHCDLKPSNVLLNNDMTGHAGEFGLARFLPEATHSFSTNQGSIGVRGSIGYAAPEYAMGKMFTGKRPTDDMFKDSLNLHKFVRLALPHQVANVADPMLFQGGEEETSTWNLRNRSCARCEKIRDCLISILQIGVTCSAEYPKERMNISALVA